MSFLDYLSIKELGDMYGLTSSQVAEIRKTAGVLQGFGLALGFFIGVGVGYLAFH